MKKKAYKAPKTTALAVKLQQMIAYSGGGSNAGEPIVIETPDEIPGTNMGRFWNDWDNNSGDW